MALSGATTPGQSGPGSDCNEEVLHITQSSIITGTSLVGVGKQLVYSTAQPTEQ